MAPVAPANLHHVLLHVSLTSTHRCADRLHLGQQQQQQPEQLQQNAVC
jgi:hypothetical protein